MNASETPRRPGLGTDLTLTSEPLVQASAWYLLQEDLQTGPFSEAQLKEKWTRNEIGEDDLIWSPASQRWEIAATLFKQHTQPRESASLALEKPAKPPNFTSARHFGARPLPWLDEEAKPVHRDQGLILQTKAKARKKRLQLTLSLSALLTASLSGALAYQSGWFSIVKNIAQFTLNAPKDLSAEERREFRALLSLPLEKKHPDIAIALAQSAGPWPRFYVATQLPKGTPLEFILRGLPETLLETPRYELRFTVATTGPITEVIPPRAQAEVASPLLPLGSYEIWAMDSATQTGDALHLLQPLSWIKPPILPSGSLARTYSRKTYFLGGLSDAAYRRALAAYHSHLQEQSKTELMELKQAVATLENQLTDTESTHFQLKEKTKSARTRKDWEIFSMGWKLMQEQLADSLTPSTISLTRRFHRQLFQKASRAHELSNQLHGLHSQSLVTSNAPDSLDLEITDSVSEIRSLILDLKAKIELSEKLPHTPQGLPQSLDDTTR